MATSPYAKKLRAAIDRTGLPVRRVAFQLAAMTGNKPDNERSALYRYMKAEQMPEPDRAAKLAVILEAPELATVPAVGDRRRGHLAELEGRVAALEDAMNMLGAQFERLQGLVQSEARLTPGGRPRKGRDVR